MVDFKKIGGDLAAAVVVGAAAFGINKGTQVVVKETGLKLPVTTNAIKTAGEDLGLLQEAPASLKKAVEAAKNSVTQPAPDWLKTGAEEVKSALVQPIGSGGKTGQSR